MPDAADEDAYLASLDDALHYSDPTAADDADDQFYLDPVRDVPAVVDIGCGTGVLLHDARRRGHTGLLVGSDPSAGSTIITLATAVRAGCSARAR